VGGKENNEAYIERMKKYDDEHKQRGSDDATK